MGEGGKALFAQHGCTGMRARGVNRREDRRSPAAVSAQQLFGIMRRLRHDEAAPLRPPRRRDHRAITAAEMNPVGVPLPRPLRAIGQQQAEPL